MKKSWFLHCTVLTAIFALFAGMSCHSPTNNNPAKPLALIAPVAGATYHVGDTMKIRWQVNDTIDVSSVVLELHHDTTILVLGTNSFPRDSTSYSWVVDSSAVSTHCYVKVKEYFNNVPPDSSGIFTITK